MKRILVALFCLVSIVAASYGAAAYQRKTVSTETKIVELRSVAKYEGTYTEELTDFHSVKVGKATCEQLPFLSRHIFITFDIPELKTMGIGSDKIKTVEMLFSSYPNDAQRPESRPYIKIEQIPISQGEYEWLGDCIWYMNREECSSLENTGQSCDQPVGCQIPLIKKSCRMPSFTLLPKGKTGDGLEVWSLLESSEFKSFLLNHQAQKVSFWVDLPYLTANSGAFTLSLGKSTQSPVIWIIY